MRPPRKPGGGPRPPHGGRGGRPSGGPRPPRDDRPREDRPREDRPRQDRPHRDRAEGARTVRPPRPRGSNELLTTSRREAERFDAGADPGGRPTIMDILPEGLPRVVPVGRLDMNTEGLLLLTTDGALKRALELPASGVPRTYRVRAYGEISQPMIESLIHGLVIDGMRYGPIDAEIERRTGRNLWLTMTLTEGKNREIRRVLEHLGLQVSRLIRVSYGPIELGDLAPRDAEEVPDGVVAALRKSLPKA